MKPKIAVAISGGIDSLITAYILKKKYKDIIGLHFLNGYEPASVQPSVLTNWSKPAGSGQISISELPAIHPITHIQNQLDIPVILVDCRQFFQESVVNYFVESYRRGLTPNPCMVCNPTIKFGVIYDLARQMGASYFATGHYARITEKAKNLYFLQKGVDSKKDQSYFLALLPKKSTAVYPFPVRQTNKETSYGNGETETFNPDFKQRKSGCVFYSEQQLC
jgi:tRNA-specific 2-thiouridylase